MDETLEPSSQALHILTTTDRGAAALRAFVEEALEHPWVTELGVLDTTQVKPTPLVKTFGRDSGRKLYETALACLKGPCIIFGSRTDRGVRRLAEAFMALPHGRTTALKRLLAHTAYRRMKPQEAHFALERDAAQAAELGLVATGKRGEKRYLVLRGHEQELRAEVMAALAKVMATQAQVLEEALTALTIGKLQERFKVIDASAYNRRRLTATFGQQRMPRLFERLLQAMQDQGYSVVSDKPLLRLLRACADLPTAGSVTLTRLLKQEAYAGLDKPMNQARTDLAHAEKTGFVTLSQSKQGRVTLHPVDPASRVAAEAARREALKAYFDQLLDRELTPKLRETLQLALQAIEHLRPDQTPHGRLKQLLTDRSRPAPLTARQASVYLSEFDTYLSRKLDLSFKLTALDHLRATELDPRHHPELYPGRTLRELERRLREHLSGSADPRREFRQLMGHLEARLFPSDDEGATSVQTAAGAPSMAGALYQLVAGLAQSHELKVHELLLLQAVALQWHGEPVALPEAEVAYHDLCARFNRPPSLRSAVTKYAIRLTREGYLARQVGPPRQKHTATRRVSYLAPLPKARPVLIELELLTLEDPARACEAPATLHR